MAGAGTAHFQEELGFGIQRIPGGLGSSFIIKMPFIPTIRKTVLKAYS
jgi:hypothetical protein|tara:strand:- start:1983 stop:2126 length:144 start_codon:yes stop_codon:yes gene_type:complete